MTPRKFFGGLLIVLGGLTFALFGGCAISIMLEESSWSWFPIVLFTGLLQGSIALGAKTLE